MGRHRRIWLIVVLFAGLAGCNRASAPPVAPASQAVVEDFYQALMRQDWPRAYGLLHPDSRQRCPQERFVELAQAKFRGLGFVPDSVHVQAYQDQGAEAVAHIVFLGHGPGKKWRYKDSILLRQVAEDWRIVLPDNFGRSRK